MGCRYNVCRKDGVITAILPKDEYNQDKQWVFGRCDDDDDDDVALLEVVGMGLGVVAVAVGEFLMGVVVFMVEVVRGVDFIIRLSQWCGWEMCWIIFKK